MWKWKKKKYIPSPYMGIQKALEEIAEELKRLGQRDSPHKVLYEIAKELRWVTACARKNEEHERKLLEKRLKEVPLSDLKNKVEEEK